MPEAVATQPTIRPPTTVEDEHLGLIAAFFDRFAATEPRWRRRNRTYYRLIESIHRFLVPPRARVLEIGSGSGDLLAALAPGARRRSRRQPGMVELARARHPELEFVVDAGERFVRGRDASTT